MDILTTNKEWVDFTGSKEFVESNLSNPEKLLDFLTFRQALLNEEVEETVDAIHDADPEEIIDGLVDTVIIALGTLSAFDVDVGKALNAVYDANFQKRRGIKQGRPNPYGMPDMMKHKDWTAPSHVGNYGYLASVFEDGIDEDD